MINVISRQWSDVLEAISNPNIEILVNVEPRLLEFTIGQTHKINGNRKRTRTDESLKLLYTSESNRLVAQAILKYWFNVQVVLDPNYLCPRIPNRLHYVKWLFCDIIGAQFNAHQPVTFLDIGAGASCIYPLLLTSVSDSVHVIASEINADSARLCRKNIQLNPKLESRITLVEVEEQDTFFNEKVINAANGHIDVCMCNPPFYSSREELLQRQEAKSKNPFTKLEAVANELFAPGGEEAFVLQMIHQSQCMPINIITWYTTMVGKKGTLELIMSEFHKIGITNYCAEELIRGSSTRRWLIAWTFTDFHGKSRLNSSSLKKFNPSLFIRDFIISVDAFFLARLRSCLEKLPLTLTEDQSTLDITTHDDVWSRNFRRKPANQQKIQLENIYNICRFKMEWTDTQLSIWFYYGRDVRVYESFIGYIEKHVM